MNENLNLVKLLKDCPKGTMLYSPIFGQVKFMGIDTTLTMPIVVKRPGPHIADKQVLYKTLFSAEGKYMGDYDDSECMLFPSKQQRDWSKFEAPFPDKALVWGWNYKEAASRNVCFYDAKNRCSFDDQGERFGYEFDHYELFKGEEPEWAKKARKKLEN